MSKEERLSGVFLPAQYVATLKRLKQDFFSPPTKRYCFDCFKPPFVNRVFGRLVEVVGKSVSLRQFVTFTASDEARLEALVYDFH
jgi:hypothetical protein